MGTELHTICYFSDAQPSTTDTDIESLFTKTNQFNNDHNIYGILLHIAGKFLQILEGEKEVVQELYTRIKEDSRHNNIYEVFNKKADYLVFGNYDSKFSVVKSGLDLMNIKAYLDSNRLDSTSEKISRLLAPFVIFDEV
ncbi:MAG: BLUF domain-containing protein [Nonlabens sp.]|uniref:BLUF domain-containing protein n=1 Tax=Nonlabens sp. TaxID=1888209 RepID=UPI003EF0E1E4